MWNFPLFPDQASSVAGSVDLLFAFTMVVTIFFSILIAFLIVYMSVKYHHTVTDVDRSNPSHMNIPLELTWTIIPLLIVLVVFFWGTKVFYTIRVTPPDAIEMYVIGKQWMWKIQHPEGIREINALHMPINTPISLTMISEDVIHNFSVPAFRVKQDVVPGRYTTMWFKATELGNFHIFCDQYCGTLHASMIGTVTVMTPQDYQQWLASGGMSPAPTGTMSSSGEEIFNRMGCATCHLKTGDGRGPSLYNLYGSKVSLDNGQTVVADDAYLRESILKPMAKVVRGYGAIMPLSPLSESNVLELISYIKSLSGPDQSSKATPKAP